VALQSDEAVVTGGWVRISFGGAHCWFSLRKSARSMPYEE